jgi:cell division inhibitor SulA
MQLSSFPALQQLRERQLLWLGGEKPASTARAITALSTGFAALDKALQGGWPTSGVVELSVTHIGIGEMLLVLPVLHQLAEAELTKYRQAEQTKPRLQCWLNPPEVLLPHNFSQAMQAQNFIVRGHTHAETVWAAEQVLKSAAVSALVAWLPSLHMAQAKRLQIAAKETQTLVFILTQQRDVATALPISLRMRVGAADTGLNLDIFKRQHARPVAPFTLGLAEAWPQLFSSGEPSTTNILTLPNANVHASERVCLG